MTTAKTGELSVLADFFSNASAQTKRDVFNVVISKAIAAQRDVLQKAEAIKAARSVDAKA
ncbi:hypothetical protein [Pseudomonas sp. MWU13-2100]|uniref:hypothetical protein n=1 Tax=Pseudomonas sp. MWU13-2100 TaxID=2935075 RepID=UPI00200DBD06|nr:hypothetical protein [Pseudomonas sp. MWU13-2100]